MTLSALIKKGGLAKAVTATLATTATQEADNPVTVAPVATVAVAQTPEALPELLSPDQEVSIRAWLAHIKETDPDIIAEVLAKCRNDLEDRRYFLKRSEEVPKPVTDNHSTHCNDCNHFEHIDYPHLGHCANSESEVSFGLWSTDRQYCEQWLPSKQNPETESHD